MKLFYNPPSPYARKVMVVILEKGLLPQVELCALDPWRDPADLHAANPIGKVPTLITDDAVTLTESLMIADYLDRLAPKPSLTGLGEIGGGDPGVMARTALAHGMMDAAFITVLERRRPPQRQWLDWIKRQRAAIERTLGHFIPDGDRFDMGDMTLACALAYLDLRLPGIPWRTARPRRAGWLDGISERHSMQATRPQGRRASEG